METGSRGWNDDENAVTPQLRMLTRTCITLGREQGWDNSKLNKRMAR